MSLCPHGYTAFYDCPACPAPMGEGTMAERLWSAGDLTNEELSRSVDEIANTYTTGYDDALLREAASRLRECDPTRVGPLRLRPDQRVTR